MKQQHLAKHRRALPYQLAAEELAVSPLVCLVLCMHIHLLLKLQGRGILFKG